MKNPELLLPAGSLDHMRFAFAYGADAVYAGPPRYSLRARNNQFHLSNLAKGIEIAHQQEKLFFCTLNLMPHNAKLKTFGEDLKEIGSLNPDAFIMSDPGMIMMAREAYPDIPVHLSVQANTVNWASVKFWKSVGIKRVILSRELSFEEIAEIRQKCPDMELEVFVHGALCIAYSGRCLLSGYFNHRDPNQGTCTNACRWNYKVHPGKDDEQSGVQPISTVDLTERQPTPEVQETDPAGSYLLEEANRKGEYMPIEEDEHGTYIMNSKDLRAIQHIARLVELEIDCFKIEGRTKSCYYVARTAQAYRQAVDDAVEGKEFDHQLLGTLENLANRGYTDGFFKRHRSHEYQNLIDSHSLSRVQRFCAEVTSFDDGTKTATILSKNKIRLGDQVEVIDPRGNYYHTIDTLKDVGGNVIDEIKGGGVNAQLTLPSAQAGFTMLATSL